nr:PREDICTED: E3 ubiquitin-protein ligase RNF170-like isoform X1 [Musa acuminata subsp. malaccensis]
MESPPQDDTCSICLGSFTHPCQANCSHWFCGECILSVWHHGSIFQQCKCPICRCFINLLKPTDASVQEGKDRKANQVLKTIKKYNRSFGGEPSNLMQKLQNLPFFIRRLAMVLMDPRRPLPSLFRAHITFALSLSAMYVLSPVDLLPEGYFHQPSEDAVHCSTGIGVVIKAEHGQMIAAGCSPASVSSELAAEIEAVLDGLHLAADKGLHSNWIRSDCLQVVKALNNYDAMPWIF